MSDRKCKCGIKAREGVVPSELGYGHYCGNAYGGPNELWVGSSCTWEDFDGRGDLMESLKDDVRRRYSVIMPSPTTWNKLVDDFPRETYDFKEEEERRDLAFFHRRDMATFPDEESNDGHLLAPKEKDEDDDEDDDHEDDDDDDHYDPDY
uniref:Uncharacterized protein n=1 Tax=Saccharum officinarum TaxID=4547 RepID=A0A678T4J9_SACOF|nr:hypothetical protein SO29L03_000005 [Saccharum officinarum]